MHCCVSHFHVNARIAYSSVTLFMLQSSSSRCHSADPSRALSLGRFNKFQALFRYHASGTIRLSLLEQGSEVTADSVSGVTQKCLIGAQIWLSRSNVVLCVFPHFLPISQLVDVSLLTFSISFLWSGVSFLSLSLFHHFVVLHVFVSCRPRVFTWSKNRV